MSPVTAALRKASCGTCDLTRPREGAAKGLYWCHGAPATVILEITATVPRPGEPPVHTKNLTGYYPPVSKDSPACARHPAVRRKL